MTSGKQAKRQRRMSEEALTDALLTAHSYLHADDAAACHAALHAALGITDDETVTIDPDIGARLSAFTEFDNGFRRLCRRMGVSAGYVLVGVEGRVVCGGEAGVAERIGAGFAALHRENELMAALAEQGDPE